MLTTKKTFQTKFLSTLLILALVSTMILAPTALAAGFGGSSITTAVADSGARNFTPTEAANDTEIQAMTDNSSVLNESDIIYMILTDRFYDADPTNNGTAIPRPSRRIFSGSLKKRSDTDSGPSISSIRAITTTSTACQAKNTRIFRRSSAARSQSLPRRWWTSRTSWARRP